MVQGLGVAFFRLTPPYPPKGGYTGVFIHAAANRGTNFPNDDAVHHASQPPLFTGIIPKNIIFYWYRFVARLLQRRAMSPRLLTDPQPLLILETVQTLAYKNPKTGLIEILDTKTGAVVAVQRDAFTLSKHSIMVETTLPTGEKVMVEKGVDAGALVHVRTHAYHQVVADLICQRIAEGMALTRVCKEAGFPPYTTVCRWRREHMEFKEALEEARRDRAEWMRDLALEEALAADEDSAQAQKLKHEAYKWAASTDLPERYSAKTKIEGSLNIPMQLVVSTGIERGIDYGRDVTNETKSSLPDTPSARISTTADECSVGATTGEVGGVTSAVQK